MAFRPGIWYDITLKNNILKILTNTGISLSAACFKNSLSIISPPHALLFFKDLIASVTFAEIVLHITQLFIK